MVGEEASAQRRRLTRAEAKAQTREQLLDAAAHVFARKGYAGASVEEIAEAAGYSTGALYSNFDGKQQLFLELLSARRARGIARQATAVAELLDNDDTAGEDLLALLARRLENIAEAGSEPAALQAEFWLYAVRNPAAMQIVAANTDERIEALTPLVARAMELYGADPAIPPEAATRVILALFQGLKRHRRIDPAVPAELLAQALGWLLTGMRPAPARSSNR